VNASPVISIVTVVLNRAETIEPALASLGAQTYSRWQHVVQDGGSTDETLAVLERLSDSRRTIVSEKDAGIYDGLNRACGRCTGDVIGVLHSDDFYPSKDVLERVAEAFADESVDAVYGDLDYVSAADPERLIRRWKSGSYKRKSLERGWMPPHPAFFVRRRVIQEHGGYDTGLRIAADYEAMLRWLTTDKIKLAYLPMVLMRMRLGGASNGSIGRILAKSREDYIAIRRHGIGGIGTLALKNLRKLPQFLAR